MGTLRTARIQGWAIDSSHPLHDTHNEHEGISYLESLLHHSSQNDLQVLLSYLRANFSSLTIPADCTNALRAILTCDTLGASEDTVLSALLTLPPAASRALGPLLRPRSLSVAALVSRAEPAGLISKTEALLAYKAAALSNVGAVGQLSNMYGTGDVTCERAEARKRLRGRCIIAESAHPYDVDPDGEDVTVIEVCVSKWAARTCIEFDRRCAIGKDSQLDIYCDADLASKTFSWSEFSWNATRGIKYVVVEGSVLYVKLSVGKAAHPEWGWKLLATPLWEDDNDSD